jgi:hypothetical protein
LGITPRERAGLEAGVPFDDAHGRMFFRQPFDQQRRIRLGRGDVAQDDTHFRACC